MTLMFRCFACAHFTKTCDYVEVFLQTSYDKDVLSNPCP